MRFPGCSSSPSSFAFSRTSSSSLHSMLAVAAILLPKAREALRSSMSISDQGSTELASIAERDWLAVGSAPTEAEPSDSAALVPDASS